MYVWIMSQCHATFDFKINVGHNDLYFIFQWFCFISWRQLKFWHLKVILQIWGARWLSGRVSDSGTRGRGFETYRRRVVSLSKTLYSPKVLVNYPGSGAPSRHDWKIVDWDVKPQHKQILQILDQYDTKTYFRKCLYFMVQWFCLIYLMDKFHIWDNASVWHKDCPHYLLFAVQWLSLISWRL